MKTPDYDDLLARLDSEAVNWSASCGDLFGEAALAIRALISDMAQATEPMLKATKVIADLHLENERLKQRARYPYDEKGRFVP